MYVKIIICAELYSPKAMQFGLKHCSVSTMSSSHLQRPKSKRDTLRGTLNGLFLGHINVVVVASSYELLLRL